MGRDMSLSNRLCFYGDRWVTNVTEYFCLAVAKWGQWGNNQNDSGCVFQVATFSKTFAGTTAREIHTDAHLNEHNKIVGRISCPYRYQWSPLQKKTHDWHHFNRWTQNRSVRPLWDSLAKADSMCQSGQQSPRCFRWHKSAYALLALRFNVTLLGLLRK